MVGSTIIVKCEGCGQLNRVSLEKTNSFPACGKCKGPIKMPDKPTEVTDVNFDQFKSEGFSLVDFWAPWCMPCKMLAPTIEEIAKQYAGRLKVGKVNTDQNQAVSMKYGIRSIPTLILFKDGEPLKTIVGMRSKADLMKVIDGAI